MVVAVVSALVGLTALALTLRSGDLVSLGGLLAVLLLINAAIRYELGRRGHGNS